MKVNKLKQNNQKKDTVTVLETHIVDYQSTN